MYLVLKASDASEWTVARELGLVEIPQIASAQPLPEEDVAGCGSSKIPGKACNESPRQGTGCCGRPTEVLLPHSSVTFSSSTLQGSVETHVAFDRCVSEQPPWKKLHTHSASSGSSSIIHCPDTRVSGGPCMLPAGHVTTSTCASDHVMPGDGLQQPGSWSTQCTDHAASCRESVVCLQTGSSAVLSSSSNERLPVRTQLAPPWEQASLGEQCITSSSGAQHTAWESWSVVEKRLLASSQCAGHAAVAQAAVVCPQSGSSAVLSSSRKDGMPVHSQLAAPREQGSQGQQCFTSTAPSESEHRLASAAAASSAPTHPKDASIRDASCSSESSSTSDSPDSRSPGGFSAPAANEGQFGW